MKWFPRFPKIRSKPSQTHSLPYNCSPEEVERLAVLRQHPAWRHLQNLLERVAQAEYDQLAMGSGDDAGYDHYLLALGRYQAASRMVDLVDTLIKKANDRTKPDDRVESDNRAAFSYSSPYRV